MDKLNSDGEKVGQFRSNDGQIFEIEGMDHGKSLGWDRLPIKLKKQHDKFELGNKPTQEDIRLMKSE